MLLRAFPSLKRLSADQYDELAFEDLMEDPKRALRQIVDFFELPRGDDRWMDRAASLLTPGKAGRATPTPEQEALVARHCHAALVLLEREASDPSSGSDSRRPAST